MLLRLPFLLFHGREKPARRHFADDAFPMPAWARANGWVGEVGLASFGGRSYNRTIAIPKGTRGEGGRGFAPRKARHLMRERGATMLITGSLAGAGKRWQALASVVSTIH